MLQVKASDYKDLSYEITITAILLSGISPRLAITEWTVYQ